MKRDSYYQLTGAVKRNDESFKASLDAAEWSPRELKYA